MRIALDGHAVHRRPDRDLPDTRHREREPLLLVPDGDAGSGQGDGLGDGAEVECVGRGREDDLETGDPGLGSDDLDLHPDRPDDVVVGELHDDLEVGGGDGNRRLDRIRDRRRRVDVGRRESEEPRRERHGDDADSRLGPERAPQTVGERHTHLLGAGEALGDELASRDREEDHRRDDDRLQDQDATVPVVEQGTSVETDQLDHAGDDGDHDRDRRDPSEPAYRVDEVFLAGSGEDDTGEEDDTSDPDGDGEGVDDAEEHAEGGEVAAGPAHPGHHHREGGDTESDDLCRRIDRPVGTERDPGGGDHEDEAQQDGASGPTGVDQVDPRRRVEASTESAPCRRGGRGGGEEQRADEGDDPDAADELDRDEVLDTLGPRRRQHDQRAEEHGDRERRQQAPEPDRSEAGVGRGEVDHDDVVGGLVAGGRGVGRRPVGRGVRRRCGDRRLRAVGRRRVVGDDLGDGVVGDGEGDDPLPVGLAVGVGDLPPDGARAPTDRFDQGDRDQESVVAHFRFAERDLLGLAQQLDAVRVTDLLGEGDDDLLR